MALVKAEISLRITVTDDAFHLLIIKQLIIPVAGGQPYFTDRPSIGNTPYKTAQNRKQRQKRRLQQCNSPFLLFPPFLFKQFPQNLSSPVLHIAANCSD